jgi:hypothetical protein
MSNYTINIGLDNSFVGTPNSVERTLAVALSFVKGVSQVRVSYDQAETAVIIDFDEIYGSFSTLAAALDQDCIALYTQSTGQGELIGPKADTWTFDIEQFQWSVPGFFWTKAGEGRVLVNSDGKEIV